ncbi:MAG: penicillin-binding protein 2 [Synergistales bacterium]|nr:penicillin-binding protein 2 [Synergistales bacterium]
MFDDRSISDSRLRFIRFVFCGSMLVLLSALCHFQVFQSDRYVQLATSNKLRVMRVPPVRGEIYDTNMVPLATNVLTFDIVGYPLDLRKDGVLAGLSSLLRRHGIPLSESDLEARIKSQYVAPYRSVVLLKNLTLAQMTDLTSDGDFPSQVSHLPVWRRIYPVGSLLCHSLGYVGEISDKELQAMGEGGTRSRYVGGDFIGKGGVERFYEDRLQGFPGFQVIEVDARGRFVRSISGRKPVPGEDLVLTIDLGAQRLAAELMSDKKGSVIAMEVETGEIKILFSNPTFDVNPLSWGVAGKEWRELISDKDRPMINRAIAGLYAPGSVYKSVIAYAALAEGVVTPKTTIYCSGSYELGNQIFRCHRRWGHGQENIVDALRDSCDVYFYEVGQKVGIDNLIKWGKVFGIGELTGIDLPGELAGTAAGREWKEKKFGERWYKGDTVNYSIGQGFLLMTPIQILRQFGVVASGKIVRPHLLKGTSEEAVTVGLDPKILQVIQKGMDAVVSSGGTGRRAAAFGVSIAGKTSTVQNSHGDDHAVFAGYAPADNPRYVAVAYIEGGLHGSTAAAPLVGELLAYLVKHDKGGNDLDQ